MGVPTLLVARTDAGAGDRTDPPADPGLTSESPTIAPALFYYFTSM